MARRLAPGRPRKLESSEFTVRRGILKKVVAIYPGTFDPVTYGHLDLIQRSLRIFDELIVGVLVNREKTPPLFTVEERLEMLRETTSAHENVRLEQFDGLLVDFAERMNADAVLRGIRAISDYEYEMQMVWMNRKLNPKFETIFMMPSAAYSYLSSRLVRQIASYGGSVKNLVPPAIEERLLAKFAVASKKR